MIPTLSPPDNHDADREAARQPSLDAQAAVLLATFLILGGYGDTMCAQTAARAVTGGPLRFMLARECPAVLAEARRRAYALREQLSAEQRVSAAESISGYRARRYARVPQPARGRAG